MMGRGMGHWTLEIKMILLKATYKLFKIHFSYYLTSRKRTTLVGHHYLLFGKKFNNNTHITHCVLLIDTTLETSVITKDL